MANVQYTVFYRYIHPISNRPVTNKTTNYKTFGIDKATSTGGASYSLSTSRGVEFKVNDVPAGMKIEDYQLERNYPTSKEFDMLYVFKGVQEVSKYSFSNVTHEIGSDTFEQVKGDPWMVASVSGSLEAAMKTAERLVKKIGINNVKLCKNVPLELDLGIE